MQTFEESFSYACPKFISPVPPNFDAPPANFSRVSTKLFVNVKTRCLNPFMTSNNYSRFTHKWLKLFLEINIWPWRE